MILHYGMGTYRCPTPVHTRECGDGRHDECRGGEPFAVSVGGGQRVRQCVCTCHGRGERR